MAATANAPARPRELTSKSAIVNSSAGGRMISTMNGCGV
jgi:hypothetical protein